MKKGWYRTALWRRALIAALLLFQLGILAYLTFSGTRRSWLAYTTLVLVSVAVCLHIISRQAKDAYKLIWVFLIMLFPVFGGFFYLLIKRPWFSYRIQKNEEVIRSQTRPLYRQPADRLQEACRSNPERATQMRYLQSCAGFPVYQNTKTEYFPSGAAMFQAMLQDMDRAKRYIFLEFFIIEDGVMWDAILEKMKQKAAQGVEVRLIYDDLGCVLRLPTDYPQTLERLGIHTLRFNPFRPFLTSVQNNRDHRKILCVDGETAYTGGINLADEYIGAVERFGHWKDAGIRLEGEAAWSLTLIFLENWMANRPDQRDPMAFYPWQERECRIRSTGLVQPYADSPMDRENVGEHVYRQIIENARRYVYITTPYLIPDETLLSALKVAAKSGVDVRIITPHRWDKKLVHMTTRSYYQPLIEAGVKIYEYSRGFMHAKTFVADDAVATVGTVNLDYRSLYLHFECGVWMCGTEAVEQVREDFRDTLLQCRRVSPSDFRVRGIDRFLRELLHVFAPLM